MAQDARVENGPDDGFPWRAFQAAIERCAESSLMRNMLAQRAEAGSPRASMGRLDAAILYSLTWLTAPRVVIETGTCRGMATTFVLAGMRDAGVCGGRVFGIERDPNCGVGSLIPEDLRASFVPVIGDLRDVLRTPGALPEAIDLFLHDASHSYEQQAFELQTFWERLRPGGVLVSHDVHMNAGFVDIVSRSYVHGPTGRTDPERTGHRAWLRFGQVGAMWKASGSAVKGPVAAPALHTRASLENRRAHHPPIAPRLAPAPHLNMLIASLAVGGAERIVTDLAAATHAAGRAGHLFVLHDVRPAYPLPEAAGAFRVTPLWLLPRSRRLAMVAAETLSSASPLVYTHLIRRPDLEGLWRQGARTVPVVHNSEPGWHDPPEAYDDPHVPFVVAVSESVAAQLRTRGCRKPVVTLRHEVRHRIDPASAEAWREEVRRRHGIRNGTLVIGMVGQFKAHKAYTRAVRVLAEVRRRRDARLMIAGGWDHAYGAGRLAFAAACRRAVELGVMADLVCPGSVQPIEPYLAAIDVFLNTSVYEGLSIATLEALNAGCPVVTANVGGHLELVPSVEENGLSVVEDASDPVAFADAVLRAAGRPDRRIPAPPTPPDVVPRVWSWLAHYGAASRATNGPAGAPIMFVTSNLNPGGAQRSLTNLLCAWPVTLARPAVCVLDDILGEHFLGQLEAAQVPMISLRETPVILDRVEALLEAVGKWGARTVCFWNADPRVKLLFAKAHETGPLRIVDVSPGPLYFEELEGAAEIGRRASLSPDAYLRRLDAFVAKYEGGRPPARLGLEGHRVHIIPNGVPLGLASPGVVASPETQGGPEPPPGSDPGKAVVTCCRIVPNKRLDWLLDAMEALLQRVPESTLTIVGGADPRHRDYANALQERVRRSAILGRAVRFAGEHGDVFRFLPRFRVFAVASYKQGCPNASLEAMACGLAVVANDDGGTREQIEDGRNGFLVAGDDPLEMAERLERLVQDPGLAARFGSEARRTVVDQFSVERMTRAYVEVLDG